MNQNSIPQHGGRLQRAAREYDIPLMHWIDLSTGINPRGWPVPPLAADDFIRLPEADDGLEAAAADYYGSADLLPVAGSQEAIRELPRIRLERFGRARVGVLAPGYEEHRYHWQRNGHQVERLAADQIEAALERLDCLVVINPCNPSALRFERSRLERWQQRLAARNGWLVVDEAFLDAEPEQSLIRPLMPEGLVVLRSLGKFFGLAGLRVGFLFAADTIRQALLGSIGHWSVATASRRVAQAALRDLEWQRAARMQLARGRQRLVQLLETTLQRPVMSTALFATLEHPDARRLADQLAQHAILVRYFEQPQRLRFGLPGHEEQWQRLSRALSELER